jgi:uncharacterized protein (TIGR03067 family)
MKPILCVFILAFTAYAADEASEKKEIDKFQGTWSVSELTYDGKDQGDYKFNFVFKGSEATIEGNDKVKVDYAKIKIKVDSSATPKILDITVAGGLQKNTVIEGIYEFKDKNLRICARVIGKERPTEFAAPEGSNVVLLVLKRE